MMKCPACNHTLAPINAAGIEVDVCEGGCGGIWFERFEMQKLDKVRDQACEVLIKIQRDESAKIVHRKKRRCPACNDMWLMRHFFSVKKQVEVDECPKCAGLWLDGGELSKAYEEFPNAEERSKAALQFVSKIFDSTVGKEQGKN